jgi:hypothetical protein
LTEKLNAEKSCRGNDYEQRLLRDSYRSTRNNCYPYAQISEKEKNVPQEENGRQPDNKHLFAVRSVFLILATSKDKV